jgi:archaeal preflagellin peptidase FlaK
MFNFSVFIFLTTFLFLFFASYFDIKKRIIPNYLVFYLFLIGLITKIIQTIVFSNINIILNSLLSVVLAFVISYILWEIGLFAGGDLKLFVAISILNPFNLNLFNNLGFSFGTASQPIFFLTLIIVSILATAPIIIIQSLYLFIFKKHHFILWNILKSKNHLFSFFSSVLVLYLISSLLNFFSLSIPILFYFIFSIALLIFFKRLEDYNKNHFYYFTGICYLTLIIISIVFNKNIFSFIDLITIIVAIKLIFLGVTIYKIIASKILTKSKKLSSLKEGDVVLNNYYKVGNKVIEKRISFFKYLKLILNNTYHKNLIIDSRRVGGLLPEDITFLNSSYKHNLEKQILLKKTIPFTPSVLVAFILLNIFGDFIWMLF